MGRSENGTDTARLAGIVDRPRLRHVLDSPFVRTCVVEGPSGVGKTTLLRTWALRQSSEAVLAWIPLSAGLDTREAFWQHVVTAAKRVGTLSDDIASRISARLGAGADPVQVAAELLVKAGPVILVLDAYEHLDGAMTEVDRDLARLIRKVPELRLLITIRGHTSLADLDLGGAEITRVITMTDLAFTVDEVRQLLAEQAGIHDEDVVRSVLGSTRGYALTVRAAVLALARLGHIPNVGSIDWDAVMATRLEAQLPDDVAVQFVVETSVAPYFDLELARGLTGHDDASALLDVLERNGFGRWIPYARDRPAFQYVESIRDSFRARARDDPAGFNRACILTAEWLQDNDDVDQALRFAIEGRDYARADRIYVELVTTKPDSYLSSRYLHVLRTVPEDVLHLYPMLAFGLGLALTANALLRSEAPRILRIAAESSARPEYFEPAVDAFSLAGMRTVAWRLAFSFRESADVALHAMTLVDAVDRRLLPRVGDRIGTVLRHLSYSLLQGGLIDEALAATARSVASSTTAATRNYSITYAAGITAFAGDLVQARAHLALIDRDAWPEDLRKSYMTALSLLAEAYLLLDAMDFEGVVDLLRDVDVYMPQAEFWPFHTAVSLAARHALGQGRAESDRVTRAMAASFPPPGIGDNVATAHLQGVLAHALIVDGDTRGAARALDGYPADNPHVASARIALMVSRRPRRPVLDRIGELVELPEHTLRSRAAAQTFGAVAALREERPGKAWLWLGEAALASEAGGPRAHVALLPKIDRALLKDFATSRNSESLVRYLDTPSPTIPHTSRSAVTLTPREATVLAAFARQASVRQVAETLVVSPHTIKTQLQGVYRKLGVSSRPAALSVAVELGLIDPSQGAADQSS